MDSLYQRTLLKCICDSNFDILVLRLNILFHFVSLDMFFLIKKNIGNKESVHFLSFPTVYDMCIRRLFHFCTFFEFLMGIFIL